MRMRTKALLLYSSAIVVSLGVAALLFFVLPPSVEGLAGIAALASLACFGVAQFVVLVCPHCKVLAILTPRRTWSVWVGSKCRHCHRPY